MGVLAPVAVAIAVLLAGCALSDQFRDQRQAQVAFDEGLQRYEARDYAGALPHLQRALMLRPTFDEAEGYLAWSEYYLARYAEAALHFRQVITRQPRWAGLYDGLGWTRYREGRYHIALQAFQQALDIGATDRDALIGSAFSLFELGQYREARPLLERLTQEGKATAFRTPAQDLEDVRSRYAWTLFYLGEYEQARAEFARGLVVHPEWYGLYNGLGWSQLRIGDRAGARASFERALKLQPKFADAREGLEQARQ
jgi:tetratricopeptide (TPR) repeat protein